MKKVINSLLMLIAIAVTTTACLKMPEQKEPDPMEPALFVYYYPATMNDMALVPTNLAKRLEFYIVNGKTEDARKKVLNGITVRETEAGTGIWNLEMVSVPIGSYPVSGNIQIDRSNPKLIMISTKDDGLTVGGVISLILSTSDRYVIKEIVENTWEIDYSATMKYTSSSTSNKWIGSLTLLDDKSNTTDLDKLEELKYRIDFCQSGGQVALGDEMYVPVGMKFDYEVIEPLYYARAKDKNNVPYSKRTSGRDKVTPYNNNGMPISNHIVEVEYANQSSNLFDVTATKVIYHYQGMEKEMN